MIKTPLSTVIGGAFWTPGATVIGGNTPTFDRYIHKLFANNEQGFFYDPNDLSTMFQDAAGTVPVTVAGQPVGLMLDKSKGLVLGDEKSQYADGFASLTGINPVGVTMALAGGALVATAQSGGAKRAEIPISGLTVGKFYKIKFIARKNEIGGTQSLQLFTAFTKSIYGTSVTSTTTTEYTFILEATSVSGVLRACAANTDAPGAQVIVESVSVRELVGNHAYQTTSAARPILQDIPILGSELIQDTEFNDPAYWTTTASVNVSGGFANFVGASSGRNINRANSIELGKTYQLTFTISAISSGGIRPSISLGTGSAQLASFDKVGTYTVNVVASGTVPAIQLTAIGTTDATVDNISVKEITGYRTDQNYLKFDGVDDKLTTTLPAQLTGCTVVRSVPGVEAQILTNQTIPVTYEDNTDHCGLIVINRALTPSETSAIAAEFNKRAGV